jgi:hypothetical protein
VGVTALLHGITAAVILSVGIPKDWPVTICGAYSTWAPLNPSLECFAALPNGGVNTCAVRTAYKRIGKLSPVLLLAFFSLLSFFFQCAPLVSWSAYIRGCMRGLQPLRWIEYSLSSTLMVIVILLLNGTYDLWTLVGVAGMNWACMIFGLLHEHLLWAHLLQQEKGRASFSFAENTAAHVAGWLMYILVWIVLISQFTWSLDAAAAVAAGAGYSFPTWIKLIIWLQFFMFFLFGVNQVLATLAQLNLLRTWSYMKSEVTYTFLSLLAKQLLIWFLYFGTIMRDPTKLLVAAPC